MVKRVTIILFSMLYYIGFTQKDDNLWWLQTSCNKIYEDNYKYAFSEIKGDLIREQIIEFIKNYINYKNRKEVAIKVALLVSSKNEKKYNITYVSNYYNFVSYNLNVSQISEVRGVIVLVYNKILNDFRVKKEVLFGLLRDRHPKITKNNNITYFNDGTYVENWITEHQIPNYILTIKDNKLIDKKVIFE